MANESLPAGRCAADNDSLATDSDIFPAGSLPKEEASAWQKESLFLGRVLVPLFHHAVVLKHCGNGAKEAFHIQPTAQMLHIPAVQLGLRQFQFIALWICAQPVRPGAHIVSMVLDCSASRSALVPGAGRGSDDRHIT